MLNFIKYLVRKLNYSKKTLHFSVAYMDAIFSLVEVSPEETKLICFICIYLAAKMEENDKKIPFIKLVLK